MQDMNGLDIYRLTRGTTVDDAQNPNNSNARYWRYEPGGDEVFVTITPKDLGITGVWSWFCGDYKIRASDIFDEMNQFHKDLKFKDVAAT